MSVPTIPVIARPIVSDPLYVTTGTNYTVPSTAPYLVLIQPSAQDIVITVSSGKSHRILNISPTNRLIVDVITSPNVTVQPGQGLDAIWDSASNLHWTWTWNTSSSSSPASSDTYLTAATHGRTDAEIGRPLFNSTIFIDTDATHFPTSVLLQKITNDVLKIAKPGDCITLSTTLLDGGDTMNLTLGRNVWWDNSATKYKQTRMTDAALGVPAILYILAIDTVADTFTAVVRPLVAQPWRQIPEYTLTGTDITNKQCGLITAGIAVNALVWFNGHLCSSLDATFNSLTGVLSWSGLALDGQALAGMKVQGLYEPLL